MDFIAKDIDEASKKFIEASINFFECNKDYEIKLKQRFQSTLLKQLADTFNGDPDYVFHVYFWSPGLGLGYRFGGENQEVKGTLVGVKTTEDFVRLIHTWILELVIRTPCFTVRDGDATNLQFREIYVHEMFIKRMKEKAFH
jgi:hypothetical protein